MWRGLCDDVGPARIELLRDPMAGLEAIVVVDNVTRASHRRRPDGGGIRFCASCGAELPADARRCPSCGASVPIPSPPAQP